MMPRDGIRSAGAGLCLSGLARVGTLLASLVGGAAGAAEFDCGEMADRLNPGDRYQFRLELQSQMIRIEKGEDFCTEPAKTWFARKLILPRPARDEMPLPSITQTKKKVDTALPSSGDGGSAVPLPGQVMRQGPLPDLGFDSGDGGTMPLPVQRVPIVPETQAPDAEQAATPTEEQGTITQKSPEGIMQQSPSLTGEGEGVPVAGVVAPPPQPKIDPDLAKRCDREVTMFWAPGEHEIDGQKFWLAGVFTIDINNDGVVDNVGFKIKTEGKIGNVLNYFPTTEGRLAGKTVESLKLEDDRDIRRLCQANLTFDRPDSEAELRKQRERLKALREAALAKELAKQKAVREQAAAEAQAEAEDETNTDQTAEETPASVEAGKTSKVVVGLAGIGLMFLVFGGTGLFFVFRNLRSMKDEDEEEVEENEEEVGVDEDENA